MLLNAWGKPLKINILLERVHRLYVVENAVAKQNNNARKMYKRWYNYEKKVLLKH